jgi:uncharacterized Zn-finger protein
LFVIIKIVERGATILKYIWKIHILKNPFRHYSFIDYNQFVRHLSRHKGEKLFQCTYIENGVKCGRRFSSSKNLYIHQMDHSSTSILLVTFHFYYNNNNNKPNNEQGTMQSMDT